MEELRIVSACGLLGYGFPEASLIAGMERTPHLLGVDAGSTDPGPFYLGSGKMLVSARQVKRDLALMLKHAVPRRVPCVLGSAGTAGARPHVRQVMDIVREIASEMGVSLRVAVIEAEVDRQIVREAVVQDRVHSMGVLPELDAEAIDGSVRIVAQMGRSPIRRALEQGVDLVVAGRACDTAIYAAIASIHGFDAGLACHMAKVIECGAQCALPIGTADCILGTLRHDHFELEPLNPDRRCEPQAVLAHMMYEQPDPHRLYEPEGMVDLSAVKVDALDARRVRAAGARFIPSDHATLKLEGARLRGYRTVTFAGTVDPIVIGHLDQITEGVTNQVEQMYGGSVRTGDTRLRFLYYGRDADVPRDVGVLIEAIAPTQADADALLALVRSTYLHFGFEGRKATAGNLAFPCSPSDFSGGPVYEFNIYHLMEVDDIDALFEVNVEEIN